MMTGWLMIAAQAAAQVAPAVPPNWAALPLFSLPLRTDGFHVSSFVQGEVKAGRCRVEPDHLVPSQPAMTHPGIGLDMQPQALRRRHPRQPAAKSRPLQFGSPG